MWHRIVCLVEVKVDCIYSVTFFQHAGPLFNGLKELGAARSSLSEAVLRATQLLCPGEMIHQLVTNQRFEDLAGDSCKGDRSVVGRTCLGII